MALLIHAQFEVTGTSPEREAYRLKLAELLVNEALLEVEERHTADRLVYDLKVAGGIPFPPFVMASQGWPGLSVAVEWVNARTDERGTAMIVDGRLQTKAVSPPRKRGDRTEGKGFASVDFAQGLRLAFVCLRVSANEYRGYAISGDQDAVFRLSRDAANVRGELLASAGAPEWSERWAIDFGRGECEYSEVAPPDPIDEEHYTALAALAESLAAEWIWFSDSPEEEIAIERARYRTLGIPERAANIRSAKLHQMVEQGAGMSRSREYSNLDREAAWVRQVLETCWAAQSATPPG